MGNYLPSCQSSSEIADDCRHLELPYPEPEPYDLVYTAEGARLKAQNGKVPPDMVFTSRRAVVLSLLPPDVLALHNS